MPGCTKVVSGGLILVGMRLDEVYGTLASFSDEELRAFVAADRRRRSALELLADQFFLGWLVRAFATDPLTEARVRASAAVREAGLPEPRPGRVAARRLVPPLTVAVSVFVSTFALLTVLGHALWTAQAGQAADNDALPIAIAAAALMAWLVARTTPHSGPTDPADVFGDRLQAAVATLYGTAAGLAVLPTAFVVVVVSNPDVAELATLGLLLAALALAAIGARVGLRTRALSGVWRPFDDAALAAVAHGRISDLDERLLTQPLDAVLGTPGALRDYRGLTSGS